MKHNIISISGGKDSTATALVALAWGVDNPMFVFADTGNEQTQTYEYIEYLEQALNINVKRVKADFSFEIMRKREFIERVWREQHVSESIIKDALSVLHPTGNPYLDLCLWKGRFPSTRAAFCTKELKINPIQQLFYPILDQGDMIISWQGVRADESFRRRYLPECDEVVQGLYNYRPILKWSAEDVFQAHFDAGVVINELGEKGLNPNPLYKQGQSRVGCMPCVNCNKNELKEISIRFPEEILRIAEWERIVSLASKRQSSTFFTSDYRGHGIHELVEWSKTSRGGKIYDLLGSNEDATSCSSAYGLCE